MEQLGCSETCVHSPRFEDVLYQLKWSRIVLDEAQYIRERLLGLPYMLS